MHCSSSLQSLTTISRKLCIVRIQISRNTFHGYGRASFNNVLIKQEQQGLSDVQWSGTVGESSSIMGVPLLTTDSFGKAILGTWLLSSGKLLAVLLIWMSNVLKFPDFSLFTPGRSFCSKLKLQHGLSTMFLDPHSLYKWFEEDRKHQSGRTSYSLYRLCVLKEWLRNKSSEWQGSSGAVWALGLQESVR